MKKKLTRILAFMMLLSALLCDGTAAYAEEEEKQPGEYQSGYYQYRLLEDGTVTLVFYSGNESELTLPSELDGYPVTALGASMFYKSRPMICEELPNGILALPTPNPPPGILSVTIPDGVTAIHEMTFSTCIYLKSIVIPDSVTSIGSHAFSDCRNVTLTVGRDSYAEQYCIENGIDYTCPDRED